MINEVEKISIIATKDYKSAIFELLQEQGIMEIREWDNLPVTENNAAAIEYTIAQIKFALDFLSENKPKEKFSFKNILPEPMTVTKSEIEKIVATNDHIKIISEVETLEKRKNEIRAEIANKEDEQSVLSSWKALPFKPSAKFDEYDVYLGTIEKVKLEKFSEELSKVSPLTTIDKISEKDTKINLAIFFEKTLTKQFDALVQQFDIKRATLPAIDTIEQTIKNNSTRIKEAIKEMKENTKRIHTLAKEINTLKIAYDYLSWQRETLVAQGKSMTSEYTFAAQGWIESSKIETLKTAISQITNEFYFDKITPDADEKPPIVLQNNRLVSPFESVTAIYGAPQPTDVDPTPYMMPFFILFFGLCLTDAGYGIILALLAYLYIKKGHLTHEQKKLPTVLMYGGIVTFFAGALFGSWFGIDLKILPEPIQGWFTAIQVMDPINKPMPSLILSAVLGIVQLISAFLFTAHIKIKKGNIKDALLDEGTWLLFFAMVALMLSAGYIEQISSYKQIFTYGVYATVVLLVVTQGRSHKNFFMKIGGGVLSLYNIVGYISDIISYSRIFALGLVTGIIAMVINIIAMLFRDMIPYLGWPIAIVILIGGHTFNLAINALSAFIHSGRLQFVEFFSKLIEGGGNWLQPLKRESQYIQLVDEKQKKSF